MPGRAARRLIIPLVAVALPVAAFLWGRQSARPPAAQVVAPAPDDSQRLAAVERELHGLRLATVTSQQAAILAQARSDDLDRSRERPPTEAAGAATADPEAEANREAAARAQHFQELNRRIESEPVDRAWRAAKEPAFRQLIPHTMGAAVTLADATCASTVCRVKLTHPGSPRIPQEAVFQFMANRGPLEGMDVQFDTSTPGATTLYFLRAPPQPP